MALYPYTKMSQETLQPGARGEIFRNTGIPGHRVDDDRINRTNNELEISRHDTLNIKYGFDPRLPALFRYGWAYGYNQIVIPKGRIVACDPDLLVLDTDTLHYHNALTLANGGKAVELDVDGKSWKETEDAPELDPADGLWKAEEHPEKVYRPANKPLGILGRNEYTRDSQAFNGIMPSPVNTDALIALPWFVEQEKAEANPWGAAYGVLKPGDYVKADVNGRLCKSPLSDEEGLAELSTPALYEAERAQVVGQVYATDKSLLPEGAARFAQWALEDRKKYDAYNPYTYPITNRAGEDFVQNPPTAYQSDLTYPGYPYDKNIFNNDLHMLASSRKEYSPRIDEKARLDRGIPGLTDGYNAVVRAFGSKNGETDTELAGEPTLPLTVLHEVVAQTDHETLQQLPDTDIETVKIKIGEEGAVIINRSTPAGQAVGSKFKLTYIDLFKGIIGITQTASGKDQIDEVKIAYTKRGLNGVPTNLDWDGCVGTVNILMQK